MQLSCFREGNCVLTVAQTIGLLRSPTNCDKCTSQHVAPSISHARALVLTLRRLSWRRTEATDKHSSIGCHWFTIPKVCVAPVITMLCLSCWICHSNGVTTHHLGTEIPEDKVGTGTEGRVKPGPHVPVPADITSSLAPPGSGVCHLGLSR